MLWKELELDTWYFIISVGSVEGGFKTTAWNMDTMEVKEYNGP